MTKSDRYSTDEKQLFIIGAGGHARVVIDVARSAGWQVTAAFDAGSASTVLDVPVIGNDDAIEAFMVKSSINCAAVAIGSNSLRRKIADKLRGLGCELPVLIHERAWVSPHATIQSGVAVMANAIIHANAMIGEDCIINTAAIVEHDCTVGPAAHIAPRSVMGGTCSVGAEVLFGIGATMRPDTRIGDRAIVGAGAVVVSDIEAGTTVVGNPAS